MNSNVKNRRKILLIIICLLICSLVYMTVQIYAKYLSTASGNTSMNIANWNIKLNDLSVKTNTDISSTIIPVFPGNEHIAPNIIAPTAEGYFDLNFDYSEVDVSFRYTISTNVNPNSSVTDLIATGYQINDEPIVQISNITDVISKDILLSDTPRNSKIRVFIKWNDDVATQTMDNQADFNTTLNTDPALFDVNVSFIQLAQ